MSHYSDVMLPTAIRLSSGRTSVIDNTLQINLNNGSEVTVARYDELRRILRVQYCREVTDSDIQLLNDIREVVKTRHSFLARDWALWNTTNDQELGGDAGITPFDQVLQNTVTGLYTGDGSTTTFYLGIRSTVGAQESFKRIRTPDIPTVRAGVNASEVTGSPSFSIGSTGILTFEDGPPPNGQDTTWGGSFYFPVKFLRDDGYNIGYPLRNIRQIETMVLREVLLAD